jgi:hypothetical protein
MGARARAKCIQRNDNDDGKFCHKTTASTGGGKKKEKAASQEAKRREWRKVWNLRANKNIKF